MRSQPVTGETVSGEGCVLLEGLERDPTGLGILELWFRREGVPGTGQVLQEMRTHS